uniref:Glycosyltransferase n=1 Tax=Kalanchoe fedtschenkoi TaxID=63787 RepID=A0A7N0VCC7_KALFE
MEMKPHIAMFPGPGIGHLTPFLELAKRLVLAHGLQVSFIVIDTLDPSSPQHKLLTSLPSDLTVIRLPPADPSAILIPDVTLLITRISLIVKDSIRFLKPALAKLPPVHAFITDVFGTEVFETCSELRIPVYSYVTASAWTLALCLYLPKLDPDLDGEFFYEPVRIPDCTPIRPDDMIDQIKNRKMTDYDWFLLHGTRMRSAEGVLVNSWEGLEGGTLAALGRLVDGGVSVPPVHAIGPVVRDGEELVEQEGIELIKWLDDQPVCSVLLVSFGSGGTLSRSQMTELAHGLEMSQQRFVWVVREPTDDTVSGSYFNAGENGAKPNSDYLPDGFLDRVRCLGRVVRNWAPQMAVLRHRSTGAFLSHCGWNSCLESTLTGVPIIAWPLFAEQKMNATLLSEEIKVVIRPAVEPGKGIMSREEVERVVRAVMEGDEGKALKTRAEEVKMSALKAVDHDGTVEYVTWRNIPHRLVRGREGDLYWIVEP